MVIGNWRAAVSGGSWESSSLYFSLGYALAWRWDLLCSILGMGRKLVDLYSRRIDLRHPRP